MRHATSTFHWDNVRSDDRPSEFRGSTSHSLLHGDDADAPVPQAPARRKSGASGLWGLVALVLVAGAVTIVAFAHHVRG